jgi:hypothetical protein
MCINVSHEADFPKASRYSQHCISAEVSLTLSQPPIPKLLLRSPFPENGHCGPSPPTVNRALSVMADGIQRQVDIGQLGVQSLGALSTLMAALTADNVQPTAVAQLQTLGKSLCINGPYARKVPEMLKRFSSLRIDRVALEIGWRRGDVPSLVADLPGGKTIALLSTCLTNLFPASPLALLWICYAIDFCQTICTLRVSPNSETSRYS